MVKADPRARLSDRGQEGPEGEPLSSRGVRAGARRGEVDRQDSAAHSSRHGESERIPRLCRHLDVGAAQHRIARPLVEPEPASISATRARWRSAAGTASSIKVRAAGDGSKATTRGTRASTGRPRSRCAASLAAAGSANESSAGGSAAGSSAQAKGRRSSWRATKASAVAPSATARRLSRIPRAGGTSNPSDRCNAASRADRGLPSPDTGRTAVPPGVPVRRAPSPRSNPLLADRRPPSKRAGPRTADAPAAGSRAGSAPARPAARPERGRRAVRHARSRAPPRRRTPPPAAARDAVSAARPTSARRPARPRRAATRRERRNVRTPTPPDRAARPPPPAVQSQASRHHRARPLRAPGENRGDLPTVGSRGAQGRTGGPFRGRPNGRRHQPQHPWPALHEGSSAIRGRLTSGACTPAAARAVMTASASAT